ncbi:MAG: hypothetical protein ABJF10_23265 [Chthoniobacter sp.]|uniref:hypothetical protein n=1 Tax=Chthoniobacter sp. TaxID=2510640 RepID=UPI0032A1DC34
MVSAVVGRCGGVDLGSEIGNDPTERMPVFIKTNLATAYFPASWRQPPTSIQSTPYTGSDEIKPALDAELRKYPKELLQRHLYEIDLFDSLVISGTTVAGTYLNKSVFLRVQESRVATLRTLHRQISNIFFKAHFAYLDSAAWKASNPANFKYAEEISREIKKDTSLLPNKLIAQNGFLSDRSTISLQDDFNVIAQNLFHPYGDFWAVADANPKLLEKVTLTIRFYSQLDPRFTEKYFRAIYVRNAEAGVYSQGN